MPNPFLCRDWTDSLKVNALSAHAERFLIRLMQKSDDYGIHPVDVLLLKSRLFPLLPRTTHTDIARWLAECEQADLIRCYVAANGRKYAQILHFKQKRTWMKSEHPPPEGQMTLLVEESKKIPAGGRSRCRREEKQKHQTENHTDRHTCAPPSPLSEGKTENTGIIPASNSKLRTPICEPRSANPDLRTPNYAPAVAKLRREMWQLLNDETALTNRIKQEKDRQQPDRAIINALITARTAIREEMKTIGT